MCGFHAFALAALVTGANLFQRPSLTALPTAWEVTPTPLPARYLFVRNAFTQEDFCGLFSLPVKCISIL